MLFKIKYFFRSNIFKKFLIFVRDFFMFSIFISFVFVFLISCVCIGIKFANSIPYDFLGLSDLLDNMSSLFRW